MCGILQLCNERCNEYKGYMAKELLTIGAAAERLGCHKSTVSRQVAALGLGTRAGPHVVVLTEAEVQKLTNVIRPRPRKGTKRS